MNDKISTRHLPVKLTPLPNELRHELRGGSLRTPDRAVKSSPKSYGALHIQSYNHMSCYAHGWYQLAFERQIVNEITAACVGPKRLILVKVGDTLRAFDADCPHRGAHLGYGGRLRHDSIICPFHGYRILLGQAPDRSLSVREYPVLCFGGMVFVHLSERRDNGWPQFAERLSREHHFINALELNVRAPMATVIENAFDQRHFWAVHGVRTDRFTVKSGACGELIVESAFYIPRDGRGQANGEATLKAATPFRAIVVSPGLAVVTLDGSPQYTYITGATDQGDGTCTVRLTLALPRSSFGPTASPSFYEPLIEYSRRGLEEDRMIWEHLAPSVDPAWSPEDHAVLEFMRFCEGFHDE